ncbi:phage portal protein [Methanobrevibacter oralis]|uniref:Phage portal protein n=1 Tax=Methanobrevibacter oralis TaxID=66851 RepID=A0A162FKG2_METOA|nr:phage portal protein [Methanobrevibacter oralis]KZX11360.1 phage portal protein [Methanobrevibacter oralis]
MGIINAINKTIHKLPGIRRPERYSLMDQFMDTYGWFATTPDKNNGDLNTYHQAYENCVWVRRCCGALCDEMLSKGFQINNLHTDQVNWERVNYLTDLFNNPAGKYVDDTFSSLIKQVLPSFKVTGDAFIEVNHDKIFDNVINGFKFIPTELIGYDYERDAWCIRNTNYLFEPENLIHIYEPKISLRGNKWGTSLIDTVAMDISLEVLGLDHNKEIFDNYGLDPRGIINFEQDVKPKIVQDTITRLKREKHKKGTIITQGANYQRTNNSNKDMEFLELLKYSRDRIITCFGVPPQKVGIIETASLGTGTGESQDKNFAKVINSNCKCIEDGFNKNLGRSGFQEIFEFIREDHENKLNRATIEDKQLRNGTTFINEVRSGYGLEPVEWGNVPMNYSQYGIARNPNDMGEVTPIDPSESKSLMKSLVIDRLKKGY